MASNDVLVTTKASSASAAQLIAASNTRRADASGPSMVVANASTAILYLLLGTGTPSATNWTYALAAGAQLEIWGYRGAIQCIWAAANGNATVTEFQ